MLWKHIADHLKVKTRGISKQFCNGWDRLTILNLHPILGCENAKLWSMYFTKEFSVQTYFQKERRKCVYLCKSCILWSTHHFKSGKKSCLRFKVYGSQTERFHKPKKDFNVKYADQKINKTRQNLGGSQRWTEWAEWQ